MAAHGWCTWLGVWTRPPGPVKPKEGKPVKNGSARVSWLGRLHTHTHRTRE
jgi:hypothetical protein